jgi:cysteine synthase
MKDLTSIENIGKTPMVSISEAIGLKDLHAYAVLEYMNPGGSHKDRPAGSILKQAIESGRLRDGMRIVEYTSGSMGISVARLCRDLFSTTICMPDGISKEREQIIRALGAELVLTPSDRILTDDEKIRGVTQQDIWLAGTRKKAQEIFDENPKNTFLINQSDNFGNMKSFNELGYQILEQHPEPIDYFVCCVGTGATWAGVSEVLKEQSPTTKIIGIDSANSPSTHNAFYGLPFDSVKDHKPHRIPGVGAGRISKITEYGLGLMDKSKGDRIELVDDEETHQMCRDLKEKGFYVGPTSGANALTTRRILEKDPNSNVVTIFFDSGERYVSTGMFDNGR